jgi:hypothetical protein
LIDYEESLPDGAWLLNPHPLRIDLIMPEQPVDDHTEDEQADPSSQSGESEPAKTTVEVHSSEVFPERLPLSTSPLTEPTGNLDRVPREAVGFFVVGTDKPLVSSSLPLIIGRSLGNHPEPHIDLAPYNAFELGVSRQHAQVKREGARVLIRDLESTNFTWVNLEKLLPNVDYPVHSGDIIRLGQLRLLIYFHPLP